MYIKEDQFKGRVFVKFQDNEAMRKAVDAFERNVPQGPGQSIYCHPDRPMETRTPLSFLLGVRWLLGEWGYKKSGVKVDENTMTMSFNGSRVLKASVVESKLKIEWLSTEWQQWGEMLQSSDFKKLESTANGELSKMTQNQGKGKGKTGAGNSQ